MDSFAAPAFFELPNPTLVISDRLLIRTANNAASKFFDRSFFTGLPLDELGIQLERDNPGWDNVLARAYQHRDHHQQSVDAGLVELPPSEEFAFRLDTTNGGTVAMFTASAWRHEGENLYTLIFYRRRRLHHPPADFSDDEPNPETPGEPPGLSQIAFDSQRAKEFARLKSALFDYGPRLGVILSADGQTSYYNKASSGLIGGIRVSTVSNLASWFSLWDGDFNRPLLAEDWPQCVAMRKRIDIPESHYGYITPDGTRLVLLLEGRCIHDIITGELIGSVTFGRVVGEYNAVQAQKRDEALSSFETITDSVPHFVWTANPDGTRDWLSKQWCEYTGLTLAECRGSGWISAVHPEDLPKWRQAREDALGSKNAYEVETRCRRWDGVYRWTLMRA